MADEFLDHSEHDEHDEFDAVLRAVARPPDVGDGVLAQISLPSTVDMAARQLGSSGLIGAEGAALERAAAEPAPGEHLDGRYRLERLLGRGGMGVVYAARNLRTGKVMAIKWMNVTRRNGLTVSTTIAERFRREARAAASVRHPNVVDVYDVGGPDEAPFLVMELLEGETLGARIRQGVLPFEEASQLMLGVMRGVSAAHHAGIVHRDLKPDNVFLCSQPDGGIAVPKVLDFGVAAIRDESGEGLTSLTRSGAIIGTPAYMSPEQLTGKPVDQRTDVYALGVMLFEALTGRLPFEARNAGELAVMQATAAPTRLSVLRPELTGACERLLKRALARAPDDRFASVAQFAQALQQVRARPTISTLAKIPSTKTGRVVLGVLTLMLLLVGLGIFTSSRGAEPAQAPAARAEKTVRSAPSAHVPAPDDKARPTIAPAPTDSSDPPADRLQRDETSADVSKPRDLTVPRTSKPRPTNAQGAGARTLPSAKTSPAVSPSDKTRLNYDDF